MSWKAFPHWHTSECCTSQIVLGPDSVQLEWECPSAYSVSDTPHVYSIHYIWIWKTDCELYLYFKSTLCPSKGNISWVHDHQRRCQTTVNSSSCKEIILVGMKRNGSQSKCTHSTVLNVKYGFQCVKWSSGAATQTVVYCFKLPQATKDDLVVRIWPRALSLTRVFHKLTKI